MAAKSLSDEIASLINPVPVFHDPEDADYDKNTIAKVTEFDTETNYQVDEFATGRKLKSLRIRNLAPLDEDDARYAGKKTSRKILEQVDDYDDESDDGDISCAQEKEEEDDEPNGYNPFAMFKKSMTRMPEDGSDELSDDSHKLLEGSEKEHDITDDDDDNINNQELQKVAPMRTFSEKSSAPEHLKEDAEKGRAIKSQLRLWDNLLKSRIQMQKAMAATNQLPRPDIWKVFLDKGGYIYTDVLNETRNKVKHLLDNLIRLQTSLLVANPETRNILKIDSSINEKLNEEEILSDTDNQSDSSENAEKQKLRDIINTAMRKHKLTYEEYPEFLHKRHCDFQQYRNSTIQRWNDQTKLTSGYLKSFNKFEQSTLTQIEQILSDKARLIKRTQLKRSACAILGKNPELISEEMERKKAEMEENGEEFEPCANDAGNNLDEMDVEIFDDNDFYHQLLRELIERKTADICDSVPLGRQWLQVQKMRSKVNKVVDQKASKGRKIRYDVHQKLVNFMAPIDTTTFTNEAKNELFNSLFGNSRSFGQPESSEIDN